MRVARLRVCQSQKVKGRHSLLSSLRLFSFSLSLPFQSQSLSSVRDNDDDGARLRRVFVFSFAYFGRSASIKTPPSVRCIRERSAPVAGATVTPSGGRCVNCAREIPQPQKINPVPRDASSGSAAAAAIYTVVKRKEKSRRNRSRFEQPCCSLSPSPPFREHSVLGSAAAHPNHPSPPPKRYIKFVLCRRRRRQRHQPAACSTTRV